MQYLFLMQRNTILTVSVVVLKTGVLEFEPCPSSFPHTYHSQKFSILPYWFHCFLTFCGIFDVGPFISKAFNKLIKVFNPLTSHPVYCLCYYSCLYQSSFKSFISYVSEDYILFYTILNLSSLTNDFCVSLHPSALVPNISDILLFILFCKLPNHNK